MAEQLQLKCNPYNPVSPTAVEVPTHILLPIPHQYKAAIGVVKKMADSTDYHCV